MKKPHQQIIQGENAAAKAWIDVMGNGDGSSLKLKEGQLAERAPKFRQNVGAPKAHESVGLLIEKIH